MQLWADRKTMTTAILDTKMTIGGEPESLEVGAVILDLRLVVEDTMTLMTTEVD
jgi:hypothetical protein